MLLPLLLAALAFAYRFLSLRGLPNDQFVHLARAQAMLAGDLPIRDYTEEGVPLSVAVSALFQSIAGPTPFAELLLAASSFAAAAGVTCWVTTRLTQSRLLGVFAALLQILVYPRLYSHPKMLVYPVLLVLATLYVERPGRARLALLGGWTAVAFLLRHDHGVYCAVGGTVAVLIAHWRDGVATAARRTVLYGAIALAVVSPYLAYVQYQLGLPAYVRLGAAIARGASRGETVTRPAFAPLRAGSPLVLTPPPRDELAPIRVRWRRGTAGGTRQAYERDLGLLYPEVHEDPRTGTWNYRVVYPATETLAALAASPDVEDVDGFDRETLTLAQPPGGLAAVAQRLGVPRVALGPPLASLLAPANVLAFVFYLAWLTPIAGLALWLLPPSAGGGHSRVHPALPVVCILLVVCTAGFVREVVDHRLSDVYGTLPIAVAAVLAAAWPIRPRASSPRRAAAAAIVACGLLVAAMTAALGSAGERIESTQIGRGPVAVVQHARSVTAQLTEWPWPAAWPAGNDWELARYVHECTGPGDRLLVTWNAPEFYYFSRRPFAGGETALLPVLRPTVTYEPLVLERLARHTVPIVLADAGTFAEFARDYPRLAAHLEERYAPAATLDMGAGHRITVFARRAPAATGADRRFGLPCFTPQAARAGYDYASAVS